MQSIDNELCVPNASSMIVVMRLTCLDRSKYRFELRIRVPSPITDLDLNLQPKFHPILHFRPQIHPRIPSTILH